MQKKNLVDILIEKSTLTDKGIRFIESSEKENFLSYKELYSQALSALSCLQNQGLK